MFQTAAVSRRARIGALEPFRMLAFLGVVCQHVLGAYLRRPETSLFEAEVIGFFFALSKFAVPAFIFLSGAALFTSHYRSLRYVDFLKKRLGSIVLPYLIWSGIYYIYIPLFGRGSLPFGKREFLFRLATGEVKYHLWYVFLIVQFYLFLPLIFRLYSALEARAAHMRRPVLLLLIAGALYTALLILCRYASGVPVLGALLYTYRGKNILYYLPYFLLGGMLARHEDALLRILGRYKAAFLLAGGASFALILTVYLRAVRAGARDVGTMGSFTPRMFFLTLSMLALLYPLCTRLASKARCMRAYAFIGRHSYGAYLSHALVLDVLSWNLPAMPLPVYYTFLFALTAALSIIVGWIFDLLYGSARKGVSRLLACARSR